MLPLLQFHLGLISIVVSAKASTVSVASVVVFGEDTWSSRSTLYVGSHGTSHILGLGLALVIHSNGIFDWFSFLEYDITNV